MKSSECLKAADLSRVPACEYQINTWFLFANRADCANITHAWFCDVQTNKNKCSDTNSDVCLLCFSFIFTVVVTLAACLYGWKYYLVHTEGHTATLVRPTGFSRSSLIGPSSVSPLRLACLFFRLWLTGEPMHKMAAPISGILCPKWWSGEVLSGFIYSSLKYINRAWLTWSLVRTYSSPEVKSF